MSNATFLMPKPVPNTDLKADPSGNIYWGPDSAVVTTVWVFHEVPTGLLNSVNLHFRTMFPFVAGSLSVFLDGMQLIGNQLLLNKDYVLDGDNQGFTLIVNPTLSNALNKPPKQSEIITVTYMKGI